MIFANNLLTGIKNASNYWPLASFRRGSSPRWSTNKKYPQERVFFVAVGDSRGAAVNDSPGDCQSRDRARPQAGESPLEHQNPRKH